MGYGLRRKRRPDPSGPHCRVPWTARPWAVTCPHSSLPSPRGSLPAQQQQHPAPLKQKARPRSLSPLGLQGHGPVPWGNSGESPS